MNRTDSGFVLTRSTMLKTGGFQAHRGSLRQVMGTYRSRFGPVLLCNMGPNCKRIANVPRVTSRQGASPDGIWPGPKVHVTAVLGSRRHPASGPLGSS
jgi:hypothetical protein